MGLAPTVLLIPGLGGSGPRHWQSLWQDAHPEYRTVVQRDWDAPDPAAWIAALDEAVTAIGGPTVLVAHSLACALVAHWTLQHRRPVVAGLLVSPSDVDSPAHTPPEARGFSPLPLHRLDFPTALVYSRTDPYVDPARARDFASCWGSRTVELGDAGHINADSGLGAWPEGHAMLMHLVREGQAAMGD